MTKPALGRGLGALLGAGKSTPPAEAVPSPKVPASGSAPSGVPAGEALPPSPPSPAQPSAGSVCPVPLEQVFPSPLQPRKHIDTDALQELAESIRSNGILQPLLVRAIPTGLELIAGERRWRAARLAGLKEVPVLVREATDTEVLEMALVENLQRENLDPIEEALGYQQLQAQFQLTQEQIAVKVGRSRVAVANAVRLLKLVPAAQEALRQGRLTVGHAKALLGLPQADLQQAAADRVLGKGLTVRQTEELVAAWLKNPPHSPATTDVQQPPVRLPEDPHVVDLENRLRDRFATKVSLSYKSGKGSLEIRFHSDDELHRILELVGLAPG
jgi:ParB family chromosome partitioning protein